jgi:general L-amino acid transport system substrate-binding protein
VGMLSSTIAALAQSGTLERVKANGAVRCGVNPGLPGFSSPDDKGNWQGLDVDVCRAIAAAVLGDARKVHYAPLSAKDRFTALQSGEIDILARNATWTLSRNAQLGLNFIGANFYDGQAFMVKASSGIKAAKELGGATICVIQGTFTEKTRADYFVSHGMTYQTLAFENADSVANAYFSGRCDAVTSDQSQLVAMRWKAADPAAHVVLPDIITKEPLSPAVRNGDDRWANVVRWSFFAMLEAEELGLDSKTIKATATGSKDPNVLRFVGQTDNLGGMLGLDNEWAVRIIEQVGNYAESFDRNIKPIGLARGVNRLWRDGGLLIAPPIR